MINIEWVNLQKLIIQLIGYIISYKNNLQLTKLILIT